MGDKVHAYNGMLDCFRKTFANEGIGAFYKGFVPNFARLGSWNVVMFMSLEKVRKVRFHSSDKLWRQN
jgi:solute carrier family 25 uncoupling protein 8/9